MNHTAEKPHTERWAYRMLYNDRIFALTSAWVPVIGRRAARAVAQTVGAFYARTQPHVRSVVRNNLSLLTGRPAPDSDARTVFVNFAGAIADYVSAGVLAIDRVEAMRGRCIGLEHIDAARDAGRGVLLATGHFGFFEFGAVVLSQVHRPVTVATLPEPTSTLSQWRANWRKRWNVDTVEVGADPFSSLNVTRALAAGRLMAVLADRPIPGQGLPVPLPGGWTAFSTSPALMAWMTGCAIVPVTVHADTDDRYTIVAKNPITADRSARRDDEIARCTHVMAASLMEEITRHPTQWYQFVPASSPHPSR
jgi:KDO2-lipid IV(A) lauroyltransferase